MLPTVSTKQFETSVSLDSSHLQCITVLVRAVSTLSIMECRICAVFYDNLKHLPVYNKNSCFFPSLLNLPTFYDSSKPNKFFHMCPSPAAQLQHVLQCALAMYCMLIIVCLSKMSTRIINVHVKAMRKEFPVSSGATCRS